MVKAIYIGGQAYSFSSRPGRSARLVIETQELDDMTAGQLVNLAGKQSYCYIGIKEEDFSPQDREALDEIRADYEMRGKTPAQRLRGVLYHVWQQAGTDGNFNDYYAREMERIIEHYKQKLP